MASPEPLAGGHPKYEQVKKLNSGAHGNVYLCKDKNTGELVAIKFIERGEKVTQYVESEILNHRRLNHPHVVQFKEVFLMPRHLGIAMEYAAGGDMFDYAVSRNKRLNEDHARWFFQQLIVALDYCHRRGVANRDIKLENTLLDHSQPPLVKLCDFGYSKHTELQSAPGSLVGTPAYLPPEVLQSVRGSTYAGPPADVWSSGVMLYTMLVGSYPFERPEDKTHRQGLLHMYQRIQKVDYKVPAALNLSPSCLDLLARILVADPAKRISIPEIYQHPWYTRFLPPGVLQMNDSLDPPPDTLQSEDEIKKIVENARSLPTAAPAAPAPAAGGREGGSQAGMNQYIDELMMAGSIVQYDSFEADVLQYDGAGPMLSGKGDSLLANGASKPG